MITMVGKMYDNKQNKPGLMNRFVIFSVALFLIILVAGSAAFVLSMRRIIRANNANDLSQMLVNERIRLENSVNSEIAIVLKLADSPLIKRHFLNPGDPELEKIALEEIASYRRAFTGFSIFWISDLDRIFYSDDNDPYWVDAENPENYWYNMTLYETSVFNFNINYNPDIKTIKLWINAPVFDGGKSIGMVGTGIELSKFVDMIYRNINDRTGLYFFNSKGEITGARDVGLIMDKVNIGEELNNIGADIPARAKGMKPGEAETFDVSSGIVAIGAIPALEWYSIAYMPDSIDDYDTAMTSLFLVVLVIILLIFIIFNVFISKFLKSLRKTMESLEIASKAKSEFLATMSHEIRTPLNAVIGLSEIELQGKLPDSTKENIMQIQQSGVTLLGIIGDILDISKIEAGRFELIPVVYETASLLSDTVHVNIVRIGSKPISFVLEIEGDFPSRLMGDDLRIKQILNNLLSNAIKYTQEGTVTLKVEWENWPEKQNMGTEVLLRFSVRDTGIGIRVEDMGKLFESYTQLETGANRKIDGTGLGLSITKKLVEMMSGKISVESDHGYGSVFTAEIIQRIAEFGLSEPACIGEETAENLRNFSHVIKRAEEQIERPYIPNCRVLVVDDNLANLNVAKGMLAPYGLSIDTAVSGWEAVEKIQTAATADAEYSGYDLILMDHMMPEMDGVETAKMIRAWENEQTEFQLSGHIPIVALTANALRGMSEFYLKQGFDDYLSKPLSPRLLNDMVKKWLLRKECSPLPDKGMENFAAKIEAQRIDKLNHFRIAFESGCPIDAEYFKRFTELLRSLDMTGASPKLQKKAASLIESGQKEDSQKIREILPVFCELLRKRPA